MSSVGIKYRDATGNVVPRPPVSLHSREDQVLWVDQEAPAANVEVDALQAVAGDGVIGYHEAVGCADVGGWRLEGEGRGDCGEYGIGYGERAEDVWAGL